MVTGETAECLRELLQAASHMECETYRLWALERIGALVPFDEARWQMADGPGDHNYCVTYREPVEAGRQPARIGFARRPVGRFSVAEQSLLMLLAAQACCAWRVAAQIGLLRQLCAKQSAALADAEGHIHAVHGHFYTLLRASWPEWLNGPLPVPLRAPAPGGAALVVGSCRWNVERTGGLLRITAQPLGAAALLTAREQVVAAAVLDTGSQTAAAALLRVSPNTVRNTLVRVYSKLGVRNRLELAMHYRAGLMCLPNA